MMAWTFWLHVKLCSFGWMCWRPSIEPYACQVPLNYITPPNTFYKTFYVNGYFVCIYKLSLYGGQKRAFRGYYRHFYIMGAGKTSSVREASVPNCWAISLSPSLSFEIGSSLLCYPSYPQTLVILHHPLSCFGYKSVPPLPIPHILYLTIFWLFEEARMTINRGPCPHSY